jgi:imidazolonepropionase-like amidohydrolase
MTKGILGIVPALGLLCGALAGLRDATAPTTAAAAASPRSFVLRAKAVYPVTIDQPGPLDGGMVIVRNGRIEAVGRELRVPPDLPVIDLRDEVVCPGFVSAGGSLVGPHTGPESVSGAYRAIDAFDTYDDYADVLARGTTTAHLSPGEHRLVSGVGAIVKLGGPPEARTLRGAADLSITLGVFGPPLLFKPPFYASSDVPIEPARRQRPDSRLGQFLELEQRIHEVGVSPAKFDVHALFFNQAWKAGLPLRIVASRGADIEGALRFVGRLKRPGYLVGLTEIDRVAEAIRPEVPLVLRVESDYRGPGPNIGGDPEALQAHLGQAARLAKVAPGVQFALAGEAGDRREDLRMAAILAVRGGLSPERALAAITRVPAEILGLADRVGSLAPGNDADLLVLTGDPLDVNSFVRQAYVNGELAFTAPALEKKVPDPFSAAPLVIRAGTIWVGDGTLIRDGSLLIENGKIQEVGSRVPHPPLARIIDAGPDSFLAPGFIDAHGHLGLEGDHTVAGPDLPVHRSVATAKREFRRVARAGVTTVMLAPYRSAPNGGQMAAIKTFGQGRSQLVARELAGLEFSLRGKDPLTGSAALRKVFQAARKYDEAWKKYEAELVKWNESGGKATSKPAEEAESVERGRPDPVTGKWEYTMTGDPLPQPVSGWVVLKLTGTSIEGRIFDPMSGEEARVSGSLHGNEVTLEVDVDTPVGKPTLRATIDREDHALGQVTLGQFSLEFEATRVDKSAVEFKVQRTRRSKDGRPVPPKLDPNLEPFRPLLAGKIPAVVAVETAAQINAALELFTDELKVPLVLLGAEGAADAADQIIARKGATTTAPATSAAAAVPSVGVVVPREIERVRSRRPYCEAADLSRKGIRVALQSDGEDGARDLPLMGLFAVREGLGGDAALKALTVDAARMYKLDDRVGSLEPGKDGDVLIFHGYPFDAGSRLERVIVGGREVPDE